MHICPRCNGTKKIEIEIHAHGKPTQTMSVECITCDGSGEITDEEKKAKERFDSIQCRCGNPSGNSHYVPDNQGRISKHHWNCNDCGGITQIG